MTVDAIILAGGKNSLAMQEVTGVTNRALTPLGDKTMLAYVAGALGAAASVGRVFVVGDVPGETSLYARVAPGETLMDNLLAGIHAARAQGHAPRLLISTSDIPFLTPAAVDDFVAQSLAADADFGYAIIPIVRCHEAFPQMKRTTLRLREGVFTGGNLMLVNPDYVLGRQETILRAYAARKRVGQMGAMLGWGAYSRGADDCTPCIDYPHAGSGRGAPAGRGVPRPRRGHAVRRDWHRYRQPRRCCPCPRDAGAALTPPLLCFPL